MWRPGKSKWDSHQTSLPAAAQREHSSHRHLHAGCSKQRAGSCWCDRAGMFRIPVLPFRLGTFWQVAVETSGNTGVELVRKHLQCLPSISQPRSWTTVVFLVLFLEGLGVFPSGFFSDTLEPSARKNEPGFAAHVLVHVCVEKYLLFSSTCPK